MTSSFSDAENADLTKPEGPSTHQPFINKWDLTTSHETKATSNTLQASQSILTALRTRRGAETAEWLNNLETQAAIRQEISASQSNIPKMPTSPSLEKGYGEASEQAMLATAVRGLDRLFTEFELYASQFNGTAEGTDYIVSVTHPIRRNNTSNSLYGEVDESGLSYAGHLSTRFWALVVRGSASRVEVFVIPAELLLGFSVQSADESGYKPLLVVEAEVRDGKIIWHIDKTIITFDMLPMLAKELFGDLIRIATGQMNEAELFAHPLQELALGKNLAASFTAKAISTDSINSAIVSSDVGNIATTSAELGSNSFTKLPNVIAGDTSVNPTTSDNPQVKSDLSSKKLQPPLSLQSIPVAQQLLTAINQDISQLMDVGTKALQADDIDTFATIKALTEKMETFKVAISTALAIMQKTEDPRVNK